MTNEDGVKLPVGPVSDIKPLTQQELENMRYAWNWEDSECNEPSHSYLVAKLFATIDALIAQSEILTRELDQIRALHSEISPRLESDQAEIERLKREAEWLRGERDEFRMRAKVAEAYWLTQPLDK